MKMHQLRSILFITITIILTGYVLAFNEQSLYAQDLPTSTPVQVSLPTQIPLLPTATPLTNAVVPVERSPTPQGAAYLEAITEANVRSQPDPESERLGTIRAGEQYTVIGQYFRWYQFQYNQSASGTGWVFDELVNIGGNASNITDLTLMTPTPDAAALQANSTLALITQTPGGVLTATAGVGALPLPLATNANGSSVLPDPSDLLETVLPTFTVPPNIAVPIPSSQPSLTGNGETPQPLILPIEDIALPSRIPPIVPILLLGGAGILGLMISSARR